MALAAGALALFIASSVLERVPHVTDSISYLFQGRILAAGRLYETPPPVPPLFAHENVLCTATRWCSIYPPGWPLLLAIGWRVHAPWLMCPLLLALAVVATWLAARRLYDSPTGMVAAAALACSPFALLMAADSMAHVPELCASMGCLAALAAVCGPARAAPAAERRHLAIAGLLAGLALLIRPATAAALLAPALAWSGIVLARRRRLGDLAWLALGAAPALAAAAVYNTVVFGGPLASGYALYEPGRFGHGGGATLVPLSTALLHNLPWYLQHLNRSLWGFPWGDLAFLLPLLWIRPRRSADLMLVLCAASLVLAYSFYYYGDVIYSGPRLVFEALGPLALLTARSLIALYGWLSAALAAVVRLARRPPSPPPAGAARSAGDPPDAPGAGHLPALPPGITAHHAGAPPLAGSARHEPAKAPGLVRRVAATAALCLLLYVPLGRRLPEQIVHHAQWYLAVSAAPLLAAGPAGLGPSALVFVAGTPWCYSTFFLANGLRPEQSGRVYVRDIPSLRAAALRAYPRTEVWLATVIVEIPAPRTDPDVARPVRISWQRMR